ncbi:alkaline phosphatase family protein [uncultured Aquimarina sp.]|uniref:alkaline phosphatase family protein n=1 Tax=uncultured Aquimarina sp. TaxID=575652 RepID=UPI002611BFE5|nr:alkaline phosphatase family protein [uncultured Aquimarina sp.]
MKIFLCITFMLIGCSIYSQDKTSEKNKKEETRKVVFIIVDGISTDLLYKSNTPFIDTMSKEGAFSEAYVGGTKGKYSETPTISAVGYNSLLTGTWVHKHNVFGNSILKPNYNYPSIFRLFKDSYPEKEIAIYSSWLDNRTKLIGEGLKETGAIKMDYAFDGLELDEVKFPHDKFKKYLKRIDAEVAREAANHIYESGPDLSWIYLEHSDDMGHIFGESPTYFNAVSYEDSLIGLIWDSVKLREQETGEDWLIIVTTDHGRIPGDGKHHGQQSHRERSTWIALSKPIGNKYFENNRVAIVDIFPTICDYLDIKVPEEITLELDGNSLINKIDLSRLEGVCLNNKFLYLQWLAECKESELGRVYISYTNNYKKGEKDNFILLGEVDIQKGEFTAEIAPPKDTKYVKVVLKTKNQTTNTWVKVIPK